MRTVEQFQELIGSGEFPFLSLMLASLRLCRHIIEEFHIDDGDNFLRMKAIIKC